MQPFPAYRDVGSPLTADMLAAPEPTLERVQFSRSLTDADHRRLAEWLAAHPGIAMRVYDPFLTDLDLLRHYPRLRRLMVSCNDLTDISGLGHLPADTTLLELGMTHRRLPLSALARFRELRWLSLEGHTKHIDVLASLTALRCLTLRSVTLPDLSLLTGLPQLRAFALKLGGTRDLRLLPGALEYLELWMVRGLVDLSPVTQLRRLEFLFLQSMRRIETLPPMDGLPALTRVWLESMPGVRDLRPLVAAPALQRLALLDMPQLSAADLAPLVAHPTLRSVRAAISRRSSAEVQRMFPDRGDWAGWHKPIEDTRI